MLMRKIKVPFWALLAVILAAGCQSVSYLPRSLEIVREDVTQSQVNAELQVNLSQKVTAVSDMQDNKKDALISAYYNCIRDNNIDVVVDPIVKYTKYSMFTGKDAKNAENAKWWRTQYKAEIVGYGGKYIKTETTTEQVQNYGTVDMENVVKYKMVTDPEFYKSYYQNQKSNVINVNTGDVRNTGKKQRSDSAPGSCSLKVGQGSKKAKKK